VTDWPEGILGEGGEGNGERRKRPMTGTTKVPSGGRGRKTLLCGGCPDDRRVLRVGEETVGGGNATPRLGDRLRFIETTRGKSGPT